MFEIATEVYLVYVANVRAYLGLGIDDWAWTITEKTRTAILKLISM